MSFCPGNMGDTLNSKTELMGVKPAKVIRGEPRWNAGELQVATSAYIASGTGNFFKDRAKDMSNDLEKASDILSKATTIFKDRLDDYGKTCSEIDAVSNKASQQLRITTEKLSQGLSRIEKAANFANLERYTILLERSAQALSILADLETKGQLGKISAALK